MIGNPTAAEPQKQFQQTKRLTFYEFLTAYRSPRELGDGVADLAGDVREDSRAPRANTRLIDYLLRQNVPGDALEKAIRAWKAAQS